MSARNSARSPFPRTALLAGSLSVGAALTLAGCGGGSTPAASSSSSPSSASTPSAAQVAAYVSCLSSHGAKVSGSSEAQVRSALKALPKTERHAAMQACKSSLPSGMHMKSGKGKKGRKVTKNQSTG